MILASTFSFHHLPQRKSTGPPTGSAIHGAEITEAAGGEWFDAEEQNDISIYHKNMGAIIDITSRRP